MIHVGFQKYMLRDFVHSCMRTRTFLGRDDGFSEGGMMRLKTLIELKFLHSRILVWRLGVVCSAIHRQIDMNYYMYTHMYDI